MHGGVTYLATGTIRTLPYCASFDTVECVPQCSVARARIFDADELTRLLHWALRIDYCLAPFCFYFFWGTLFVTTSGLKRYNILFPPTTGQDGWRLIDFLSRTRVDCTVVMDWYCRYVPLLWTGFCCACTNDPNHSCPESARLILVLTLSVVTFIACCLLLLILPR